MARVDKSSGIDFISIWNGLEKAASSHPRTVTIASAILATLSYLSSKSKYFFRWPVTIFAGAGSIVLIGMVFRGTRATVSDSSDKRGIELEKAEEIPAQDLNTCIKGAIFVRIALHIIETVRNPIDEEPRTTNQIEEEDLFTVLAREAIAENIDFEKNLFKDVSQVAISLPKSDLSVEKEESSEADGLLETLTEEICNELIRKKLAQHCWLYVAQTAMTCCSALRSRWDASNFSDKVKQSFSKTKEISAVLIQKNLSCSLEGLFVIANLLIEIEEDKKILPKEFEPPDIFDVEPIALVTRWNILEPLKKSGYSLEEVVSALLLGLNPLQKDIKPNLFQRQAKESINLTRQVSELMYQHVHRSPPFRELFSALLTMKEQMGSLFNGFLASNPEEFCCCIYATVNSMQIVQFLRRKGYTQNEIMSAGQWLQEFSFAQLQANPLLDPESVVNSSLYEDTIKTAREFSSFFEKRGETQYSIEEILPAANDLRLEHKKSLEDLLKEDPETLYAAVQGKMLARRNPGLLSSVSNALSGLF